MPTPPQTPKPSDQTITRDPLDAGVPMLPGSPDEPQGPEDAIGLGPKRGDYTDRILTNPHQAEPVKDPKPGEPHARLVAQAPRAEDIGDEPGEKGGVTTS